jgi:hypothetical protein
MNIGSKRLLKYLPKILNLMLVKLAKSGFDSLHYLDPQPLKIPAELTGVRDRGWDCGAMGREWGGNGLGC